MSNLEDDAGLRSDVRRLGEILGQTLVRQEGQELLDLVESIRKAVRENKESSILENVTDERMRQLFTELSVEPVRTDGAVSEKYVSSIVARLREVLVSRKIADLKSSLQRLNPVENEAQYNATFAELVALETQKRGLHELSIGSL